MGRIGHGDLAVFLENTARGYTGEISSCISLISKELWKTRPNINKVRQMIDRCKDQRIGIVRKLINAYFD